MKTLYLECSMGAAGDMLTAALLELLPDRRQFTDKINSAGMKNVSVRALDVNSHGICGTHISVTVNGTEEESEDCNSHHHHHHEEHGHHHDEEHDRDHHHHDSDKHHHGEEEHSHGHEHEHSCHHGEHSHHSHTSLHDTEGIINSLDLPEKVKSDAINVYRLIAEAEGHAHGKQPDQIHFHEVGSMDAVADICGVCLLMDMISPDRVIVSPVNTGYGHVRCAHGILPVPAPATEFILHGIPSYSGNVEGELCTPTGAALLKYFADDFGGMPVMRTEKTGYGIGKKEFPVLNSVRAFIGETDDRTDEVTELICNIDDMTGEALGYAVNILLENGALDVFTTPAGMKKSRPGVMLTCLCRPEDRENILKFVFRHTTTIGIRENVCRRYTLSRKTETVSTPYGDVRVKKSEGYGVTRCKAEYEDIAAIASEKNLSVSQVEKLVSSYIEK